MIRSRTNLFHQKRGTKTRIIESQPPPFAVFHEELKVEIENIREEIAQLAKAYQKAKLSIFEEVSVDTLTTRLRVNKLLEKWKHPPPCIREHLPILQNILALNYSQIAELLSSLQKINLAVAGINRHREELENASGF